jgi:hypothetical protein
LSHITTNPVIIGLSSTGASVTFVEGNIITVPTGATFIDIHIKSGSTTSGTATIFIISVSSSDVRYNGITSLSTTTYEMNELATISFQSSTTTTTTSVAIAVTSGTLTTSSIDICLSRIASVIIQLSLSSGNY